MRPAISSALSPVITGLAVLATVVVTLAIASGTARAQNPPATFFGTAPAGATIEAFIEGQSCGSADANGDGEWVLVIADNTASCAPTAESIVTFTVNGEEVEETFVWRPGGATEISFGPAGVASTPSATPAEERTAADPASAPRSTAGRGVDRTLDAVVVAVFVVGLIGLFALVAFRFGRGRRLGGR